MLMPMKTQLKAEFFRLKEFVARVFQCTVDPDRKNPIRDQPTFRTPFITLYSLLLNIIVLLTKDQPSVLFLWLCCELTKINVSEIGMKTQNNYVLCFFL